MSGISRIGKFVAENSGCSSYTDAENMRNLSLNIVLGRDDTGKVAMMAVTALNLAVRCFKGSIRIYFTPNGIASLTGRGKKLMEVLTNEAFKADASERITFVVGKPAEGFTLTLCCEIPGGFIADCAGWIAYINRMAPYEFKNIPAAPPTAVFATACAFAKLFKASVLNNPLHTKESWQFSLLRLDRERTINNYDFQYLSSINLGVVSLIGAGAIGSAVAFVLSLADYQADMLVIDKDRYEEPNFETTMLISKSDELQLKPKSPCITEILNNSCNIRATAHVEEINASSSILSAESDILICGVDNDETRRELDNTGAKVILNGGIGGRRENAGHILISRHLQGGNYPLSKLYLKQQPALDIDRPVPIEFSEKCSRVSYLNASMAAPFFGTALGALIVARCAQEVLGIDGSSKYLKFDLLNLHNCYETD